MRGAPKDPTQYPPEYYEVVEFFRREPNGTLTLRFVGPGEAQRFRQRFYGWRDALLRSVKEGEADPRETLYPLFKLSVRGRGAELEFVNGDEDEGVAALREALAGKAERPQSTGEKAGMGLPTLEIGGEESHKP
jgi:hypothetical protein